MNWFPEYNYILASKSPRRSDLLKSLGLRFEVIVKEVEENYPPNTEKEQIPVFLSKLKAQPFLENINDNDLIITADTIVWADKRVLGKPKDRNEAVRMLNILSGDQHEVISGVTLTTKNKQVSFYSVSDVFFKELTNEEINYYITNFQPFDKAGAYGIQEWIGCIGITHIQGSFYNVMGLPVQKLYEEIQKF